MTAHPLIGELEGTDLSFRHGRGRGRDLPGARRGPFGMLEQGGADGVARDGGFSETCPDIDGR